MKCPNCHEETKTFIIYQKSYHKCVECMVYYTPDLEEIEDIVEYKNEIRRKALKKLLGFTEIHE